ncbi:MAG: glycosyltransferase family 2 protein, partial [Candidatus Shapirobacteria bacterium]|nr:glycosyltransferase family 2 protein [Candidatus Shapirobacteria bacterium]
MKVSVIITNWNGLDLLKKNLEQVIKMSPEAQEIIVADDASSDKSVSYIKELQKKYSKLKLITHKNNLGFGKNSNNAIFKSKG